MKKEPIRSEYPPSEVLNHLIRAAADTEPLMTVAILLQVERLVSTDVILAIQQRDVDMQDRCITFREPNRSGKIAKIKVPMIPAVYELLKLLKVGKTSAPLFAHQTFEKRLRAINLKAGDQMLAMNWRGRDKDYTSTVEFQLMVIFLMAIHLYREEQLDKSAKREKKEWAAVEKRLSKSERKPSLVFTAACSRLPASGR